jgi:transposase
MNTDVPQLSVDNSEDSLPDDPLILKQMIAELLATLQQRDRENEHLQHRLQQLLRRLYGPRAERYDPNQPLLFGDLTASEDKPPPGPAATVPADENSQAGAVAKKNGHGRGRLPATLPRIRVEHRLAEDACACSACGNKRVKIGEEISEQLDYQPASLFVCQHVRFKYACPKCQGQVVVAGKPAQPIDKGLPGPGLLAQVIVSKYDDHLPLHRLERIFSRHGQELPRQTTCDWMAACAGLLTPIYELMVKAVRASQVIHTDDTPVSVQDKNLDRTRAGRMWIYLGDKHHPYNVFDYTASRARDGPKNFLRQFRGYMQADAFAGYDGIYANGQVHEVACWAHARRKFYDARDSAPERAHTALAWIRKLYDVEDEAKELADTARQQLRHEKALPLLRDFENWLRQPPPEVLPKSPIGQASAYALNNWPALVRYTEAGFLAIDNNAAERALRAIAIGRKNWLFVGSDNGGRTAAVLFSFTSTCRRLGVDPFAYLRDVLNRLPTHPTERLSELLPDAWTAGQAKSSTELTPA